MAELGNPFLKDTTSQLCAKRYQDGVGKILDHTVKGTPANNTYIHVLLKVRTVLKKTSPVTF